jgi:hypothetical protein
MQMTGFDQFWAAWPKHPRKGSKALCRQRWIKHHHETQTETIIAHVNYMKTTMDWLKEGGAFICAPLVYLNQQKWDGAEIPDPQTLSIDREAIYRKQLAASIASFK